MGTHVPRASWSSKLTCFKFGVQYDLVFAKQNTGETQKHHPVQPAFLRLPFTFPLKRSKRKLCSLIIPPVCRWGCKTTLSDKREAYQERKVLRRNPQWHNAQRRCMKPVRWQTESVCRCAFTHTNITEAFCPSWNEMAERAEGWRDFKQSIRHTWLLLNEL